MVEEIYAREYSGRRNILREYMVGGKSLRKYRGRKDILDRVQEGAGVAGGKRDILEGVHW